MNIKTYWLLASFLEYKSLSKDTLLGGNICLLPGLFTTFNAVDCIAAAPVVLAASAVLVGLVEPLLPSYY